MVKDYPLAFVDPSTVDRADLMALDQINNTYLGEVFLLCHRDRHRWYWLSDQTAEELMLFSSFDTKSGSGCLTPHFDIDRVN